MDKFIQTPQEPKLYKWLEEHNISGTRLPRQFSDGIKFATLLKTLYPKLVDMHNYGSHTSFVRKLANWETINFKVLSKLGLNKPKSLLEKLANGTPGAIERLLKEVMEVYLKSKEKKKPNAEEQLWIDNEEVVVIKVKKNIGDALIEVPQKMILYSIYEKEREKCEAKDAIIESSKQKIAHLEHLILLKNQRIEELSTQMALETMKSESEGSGFPGYKGDWNIKGTSSSARSSQF